MASQDCHTALAGCARESCEDGLGFGNPSQQSPNLILIMRIAVRRQEIAFLHTAHIVPTLFREDRRAKYKSALATPA
jgi:hypothetical protein